MAPVDRGLGRWRGPAANPVAVSRRPLRRAGGGRLRCPGQTRGIAVEPAATEFSWILEDNKPSLEGAHAIGAQLDKLYRI